MMRHSVIVLGLVLAVFMLPCPSVAQTGLSAEYHSVSVNGISLAYRVFGEGDPVVLLHGFAGTGERWDWCVEDFAQEFRLIIPDLRGHGRSTNPSGEFTTRQAALDIIAALDSLGVGTFKAIGSSAGAMMLLHIATIQPDRIKAMVLVSGTSYLPEQARAIYRQYSPDSLPPGALENIGRVHARGAEQARELVAQFHGFKDSYNDLSFTPPLLSTITAQTLIVHGDRDEYFPVSIPVEQYLAIPNSYLWIVPNGGHAPFAGSERGQAIFSEIVLDFLMEGWR